MVDIISASRRELPSASEILRECRAVDTNAVASLLRSEWALSELYASQIAGLLVQVVATAEAEASGAQAVPKAQEGQGAQVQDIVETRSVAKMRETALDRVTAREEEFAQLVTGTSNRIAAMVTRSGYAATGVGAVFCLVAIYMFYAGLPLLAGLSAVAGALTGVLWKAVQKQAELLGGQLDQQIGQLSEAVHATNQLAQGLITTGARTGDAAALPSGDRASRGLPPVQSWPDGIDE